MATRKTPAPVAPDVTPVAETPAAPVKAKTPRVRKPATPPPAPPEVKAPEVSKTEVIDQLVSEANAFILAGVDSAMQLADVLVQLYPLKPWIAAKSDAVKYFKNMGISADNFRLPFKARQHLVAEMYAAGHKSVEHIAAMTGAGVRTIGRDLGPDHLNLVSETRSAAQTANAIARNTPRAEVTSQTLTAVTPVTDWVGLITSADAETLRMVIALATDALASKSGETAAA